MKIKSLFQLTKAVASLMIISIIFYCTRDSNIQPNNTTSEPEICKILFIGSSYFNYNNLPEMFKILAETGEKKVLFDRSTNNGTYLDFHSTN